MFIFIWGLKACSALQQLNSLLFMDPAHAQNKQVCRLFLSLQKTTDPSIWLAPLRPAAVCSSVRLPSARASFADHVLILIAVGPDKWDRSEPAGWAAGERGTDTGCSANIWPVQLHSTQNRRCHPFWHFSHSVSRHWRKDPNDIRSLSCTHNGCLVMNE